MAEMVVNKQSLGHIAEQLGSVIGEEQTSLLCEWFVAAPLPCGFGTAHSIHRVGLNCFRCIYVSRLEKEVRVLNGEAAAVAPAVESAATAASAPGECPAALSPPSAVPRSKVLYGPISCGGQ
jgi:hypothetical protein